MLESDDKLLSLGVYPFESEFFSYRKIYGFERLAIDQYTEGKGLMKIFLVVLETDAIREVRQIYTIWDVLGDIGGLADMLQLICWPIITLFHLLLGNGINRTLLQNLFKVQ